GTVRSVDGHRLAGFARAAGAPGDKGAGARLLTGIGEAVEPGTVLYELVSSREESLLPLEDAPLSTAVNLE
ncbi:MAG: hypothetical protein AAGF49_14985, partial [Pseudomonadota bacterium]